MKRKGQKRRDKTPQKKFLVMALFTFTFTDFSENKRLNHLQLFEIAFSYVGREIVDLY